MVDLTLTMFSSLLNLYLLFVVLFFRVIFNNWGKCELSQSSHSHSETSHSHTFFTLNDEPYEPKLELEANGPKLALELDYYPDPKSISSKVRLDNSGSAS